MEVFDLPGFSYVILETKGRFRLLKRLNCESGIAYMLCVYHQYLGDVAKLSFPYSLLKISAERFTMPDEDVCQSFFEAMVKDESYDIYDI